MKIVIIGGGTVGAAICAELSADKHDITVIDKSSAAVEEITSTSDVFGVVGTIPTNIFMIFAIATWTLLEIIQTKF